MLNALRSWIHLLFMGVTLVPFAIAVLAVSLLPSTRRLMYPIGVTWLRLCINSAKWIVGIRYQVSGQHNLPQGHEAPAVLLVKHQSTYETFLMPVIMPHPLAYVFKKELLAVPFFGWAIGRLDMVHIDRSQRAQAFQKVVEQGRQLLAKGTWVIMFPEGTRIPRGQAGTYKTGGSRLAVEVGVPVIPIAITSAKCWPRKAIIKRPGVVDVSIGAPIDTQGQAPEAVMAQVEQWIESEMQRLDPEAYSPPRA
jgi:1-acyl-sn-glycerol-3-phosphate acyltransferase